MAELTPATGEPTEHRRAWDAIPWYVAGTAPEPDAELLRQHLPRCEACREELQFHERLCREMRAGFSDLGDPEPGLKRLLARIAAADETPALANAVAPSKGPQRWLMAAVLVQAVGLGAAAFALLGHQMGGSAEYRTYTSAAPAPRAASLRLVPAPGMDFAALRALLAELQLELVEAAPDGSSLGLAPADGLLATQQAALPRLRAHPGVLLAEPTGHGPR